MTMHYHGTPLTPKDKLTGLAGRSFCVRFKEHRDVETCHRIGCAVMLDNGAFSFWRQGTPTDWPGYYDWAERWLDYHTTWAVIPDVIDGTEEENDALIREWPFGVRGAPVWHMHESVERFQRLVGEWPRVCIGSSGQYAITKAGPTKAWHYRMEQAMNAICTSGPGTSGPSPVWLHMLRGMRFSDWDYPFASVDSTDIAQNHFRPQNGVERMADRWDAKQCPARWTFREQLEMEAA